MEQSSSYDEETIRHQFDRKCKLALQGEKVDYERHLSYRQKHEILFCELPKTDFWKLSTVDEYTYMVNNSSSRKRYASPKAGTELYLDLVFRQ